MTDVTTVHRGEGCADQMSAIVSHIGEDEF